MIPLGEWYVKENPGYDNWHRKQKHDILLYQLKIYGIPALLMLGLGFSHYFVKSTSILCFSLINLI
ncbi:hypothetical protein CN918_31800 [Priestia megaterium]|nr:hypothetical protein CN918_31800 [Priestia megaterium]